MKCMPSTKGMTLVEMILAVSLVAMLAAVMFPAIQAAIRGRENAECVRKLRTAIEAFELYNSEHGSYPRDQIVPRETEVPAMEAYYFPYYGIDWWADETDLGGRWDWDVGYHGFAQSISIWHADVSQKQLEEFDNLVDDGDLSAGRLRMVGSQFHYILEE